MLKKSLLLGPASGRCIFCWTSVEIFRPSNRFINLKFQFPDMVGNISNFTRYDLLRCFLAVEKNISRNELVKQLSLGEGTIRTILDILKKKNLITSTRQGHSLTEKGTKIRKRIANLITLSKKIDISLYPKYKKIGIIVKRMNFVDITIEKRDVAVKNGAEGCLIFSYSNNKLNLLIFNINHDFSELKKYFELQNNDTLIITFSDSYKWAEISALAVAIALNKELQRIFNSFC